MKYATLTSTCVRAVCAVGISCCVGLSLSTFARADESAPVTTTSEEPLNEVPQESTLTVVVPSGTFAYDGRAISLSISLDTGDPLREGAKTYDHMSYSVYPISDPSAVSTISFPTDAGEYRVDVKAWNDDGMVWKGSTTYTITPAKNSFSVYPTIDSWTEGETAAKPMAQAQVGQVSYEYKAADAPDSAYSTLKPATAGRYAMRAVVVGSKNYEALKSDPVAFEIYPKKKEPAKDTTDHAGEGSDAAGSAQTPVNTSQDTSDIVRNIGKTTDVKTLVAPTKSETSEESASTNTDSSNANSSDAEATSSSTSSTSSSSTGGSNESSTTTAAANTRAANSSDTLEVLDIKPFVGMALLLVAAGIVCAYIYIANKRHHKSA